MARQPRKLSKSKIYHIIIKGIDNQEIFYDDKDRKFFMKQLNETKKMFDFNLYAYCLMGNHVHLVIKVEKDLAKVLKSISVRYVWYFNTRYRRSGPLFQNRFKSKNIEDLKYFLEVCRYVHRNPEKAGLAKTSEYKWSSYQEYLGIQYIIDKTVLMHYYNDEIDEFIKYTNKVDSIQDLCNFAEFEMHNKLTDNELAEIIMKQFNLSDIEDVATFFKTKPIYEKKECIEQLKLILGTTKTQIARVSRLNVKLFD